MHHARRLGDALPAFMNVRVVRHLWHAGTGKDSEPEWDRFALMRDELISLGYATDVEVVERAEAARADAVWDVALAENK